jgi:hypothetical protein
MKKYFALFCLLLCQPILGAILQPQYAYTRPDAEANVITFNAQSQWQTFSSKAGGFSVLMPGIPKEETDFKEFPVVGKGEVHLFTIQSELGTFVAGYIEIPGLAKQSQSFSDSFGKGFLSTIGEGTAKGAGGKVVKESDISYGNDPGKEILIETPSVKATVRAYFINRHGYQLIAAPGASGSSETVKRFLDSFKIITR